MRSDRFTKVMLTVIAVALVAIALERLETPTAMAESEPPRESAGALGRPAASERQDSEGARFTSQALTAGPATLPLRWHVPNATLEETAVNTYCATSITVTNTTAAEVSTQVEYFGYAGSSLGFQEAVISAERSISFWLDPLTGSDTVYQQPMDFGAVYYVVIGDFDGRAAVHADDPRIITTAYMVCRSGFSNAANIIGLANVPTFPVGATAEYFVAGMPTSWVPSRVEPDLPE